MRPDFHEQFAGNNVDHDYLLALSLSQMQFTGRGGDHAKEANRFSDWNYMAIMAIAKAVSRSVAKVHDSRKKVEGDAASGDEAGDLADDDFRWWHLLRRPNPWQTGTQLRMENTQQLHLHGMAMTWDVKNGFGKTVMRIPLPLALLTPIAPGQYNEMPFGGVRVQNLQWVAWHTNFSASALSQSRIHYLASRMIPLDQITMAAYPHAFLRGDGYSPTTAAEGFIDLLHASQSSALDQYRRGPNRKVLVQPPKTVGSSNEELDAFQRRMDRRFRDNESNVVAIPLDKVQEVTIDPTEMEYLRVAETYGPGTLAMHGVSKAVVGLTESMTYGSIAAAHNAFIEFTVQPDLDLLAAEDTATIRAEEGQAFTAKYTANRAHDPELTETQVQTDVASGAMTVGELRELRGRARYGDERDDMIAGSEAIKRWAPEESIPRANDGSRPPEFGVPGSAEPPDFLSRVLTESKSMVAANIPEARPPVIAFDLDGTLAEYDAGDFDEARIGEPHQGTVEVLNLLRAAGFGIVIYTSRDNDVVIQRWLDANDVPWDGINQNPWAEKTDAKVMADVYIDDRAVSAGDSDGVILNEVLKRFRGDDAEQRIRDQIKKSKFDRRYRYLAIPVTGELKGVIEQLRQFVPGEQFESVEKWPHITVLYGIVDGYDFEFTSRMRLLSRPWFELSPVFTVLGDDGTGPRPLVVELQGDDLFTLRELCEACFPHIEPEHVGYRPHITLGYLKPEAAAEHDGQKHGVNLSAYGEKLLFRQPNAADVVIPLK